MLHTTGARGVQYVVHNICETTSFEYSIDILSFYVAENKRMIS